MSPPAVSNRRNQNALAAMSALVLAVLLSAGAALSLGVEHRAWAGGAPPELVHVSSGKAYQISVPGGVQSASYKKLQGALTCGYRSSGVSFTEQLTLSVEDESTKATNVIATFTAPLTGRIAITCASLGSVYVDDADDSGFDWATLLIMLASLTWLIFAGSALSVLWRRRSAAVQTAGEPQPSQATIRPPSPL